MKQYSFPAIRLTVFSFLLLVIVYAALVWSVAQVTAGNGKIVSAEGKIIGFENLGQQFGQDKYFWSRPSAVSYNAAGSGGSNKAPSNADYLKEVQSRIDTFLAHHPGITRQQIPAEMITASGSGLDPDISPAAAYVQAGRIAKQRGMSSASVHKLIAQHTEQPFLGVFGPPKIDILQLNLALDQLNKQQ